jgi:hypothetical protein
VYHYYTTTKEDQNGANSFMKSNWIIFILLLTTATVYPQIVSEETFEFGNCRKFKQLSKIQTVIENFNFLPNKLKFKGGNYSREETIQGRKLSAK